jgi:hypothetical protein
MSDDKSKLQDLGLLAQDVYSRNNSGTGPAVNGWTPLEVAAADIVTWAQALAALAPQEPVAARTVGAGDVTVEDDETETPAEQARRQAQRLLDKAAADPLLLFGVGAGVGLAALIGLGLGVAPSDAVAAISTGVAQDSLARTAQAAQDAAVPTEVSVVASLPMAAPAGSPAPVVPVPVRLEDIVTLSEPPAATTAADAQSAGGGASAVGLLPVWQRRVSADEVQIDPVPAPTTSPSLAPPESQAREPVNLGPVPATDEFTATDDWLTLIGVGKARHGSGARAPVGRCLAR